MTFLTRGKSFSDLNEGRFLSTGELFTSVSSNGGQVSIVVVNNNGYDIYVPSIVVRSEFAGRIEKGFNADISTEGESLEIQNKKSSIGVYTENVNVFTAGDGETGVIDTSTAESFNDKLLLAGKATSPGTMQEIGGNILQPGDNMYIRLVNTSSENVPASIDIDYIETDSLP